MIRDLQLAVGDICGDATGLRVKVEDIDMYDRVHFTIIDGNNDENGAIRGEMSHDAFLRRFLRLHSSQPRAA